jgi:anionic cell wall polymer biosynthesis LytR-Cps2A-Psr (LCP) family protein
MRFRHSNTGEVTKLYNGSDLNRIDTQQAFIKEFIRQKASIHYLPKLREVARTVLNNVDTNISLNEILLMLQNVKDLNPDTIKTFLLPGDPIHGSPWYYIYDKKKTDDIMNEYFIVK